MRRCGLTLDMARPDADDAGGFREDVPGDGRRALRPGLARLAGVVPPAGGALAPAGALSGGRQRASGAGRADGGAVGPAGGAGADLGPRFDAAVSPGGYAWWYVDAFSDDGRFGLTIIAFVGSVFSPYYAWRGRRDAGKPLRDQRRALRRDEALGDDGARRGALRRSADASRRAQRARLGRRAGSIFGSTRPARRCRVALRGRVRLEARLSMRARSNSSRPAACLAADRAAGARLACRMERPALSWRGSGYFDANRGDEPLERRFVLDLVARADEETARGCSTKPSGAATRRWR